LANSAPSASTLTLLNPPAGSGQGISTNMQNASGQSFDLGINLVGNSISAPSVFTFDLSTSSNLGLTPQDFAALNAGSTFYAAVEMVIASTDTCNNPTKRCNPCKS
jgi:hypothetical protein